MKNKIINIYYDPFKIQLAKTQCVSIVQQS